MFSSIMSGLGVLNSFIGGNRASNAQESAAAQQAAQAERNYQLGLRQLEMQQEENEYQREMEKYNRAIRENERAFGEGELTEYKDRLVAERMQGVERQLKEDRSAARLREFNLSQLLRNQQISGEERARAIAEMEEAQSIARGERDEERREYLSRKATAQAEQQFRMEEYSNASSTAASERAFEIEQMLRNQNIKGDERAQALDMLAEAKATAGFESERDYQNFLEAKATRASERRDGLNIFERGMDTAAAERQDIVNQRNAISQAVDSLRTGLRGTQRGLQDIPDVQMITDADIRGEIDRRTTENLSDVDRAATAVASVNEADLIRSGMDASTTGTAKRGDIAARLSQEFSNARSRAYNDALGYISGKQGVYGNDINQVMKSRQAQLDEEMGIGRAGIQDMIGLPTAPSANSALQFYNSVPTAAYDRAIGSANNFDAPLQVGSSIYDANIGSANAAMGYMPTGTANIGFNIGSGAGPRDMRGMGSSIYDSINIGTGLGDYRAPSSAATVAGLNLGSAVSTPYQMSFDPSSYFSASNSGYDNIANNATSRYNSAATNSANAGEAFGRSINDWWLDGGDDFFNEKAFGKDGSGGFLGDKDSFFYGGFVDNTKSRTLNSRRNS
jgi:hypothetical protein